jgi:hypothetical protein
MGYRIVLRAAAHDVRRYHRAAATAAHSGLGRHRDGGGSIRLRLDSDAHWHCALVCLAAPGQGDAMPVALLAREGARGEWGSKAACAGLQKAAISASAGPASEMCSSFLSSAGAPKSESETPLVATPVGT